VMVLLLLAALALSVRRERATARRLAGVAVRLDLPGGDEGEAGEDALTRLERLAEDAVLRVSEADGRAGRMAATLQHLPLGVVVCDERARVVHRNGVASDLTGTTHGELIEEAVTELLHAAVAGEQRSRAVELVGPSRRTFAITGVPIDDGRRTLGGVAVVEDISARRRLEVTRRSFIRNTTAELKAPVGALALLAGTIVAEDDPALTRRLARRLEEDCLHVGRIVDDLMELSRIEAVGELENELIPVHLAVAQAVEAVRPEARHRRISIDAAEAPRRVSVLGDRRQLVSALRRMVENAVRFSDDGSGIDVDVAVDGNWVDIQVQDEGAGIPERELDRIFECFYRVDRDGARHPAGTGLGLAIASQVAAGHGGKLLVTSKERQGSLFTLRLPAAVGSRAQPATQAG
jgi:two-component system sensor histidine kinase SenX3